MLYSNEPYKDLVRRLHRYPKLVSSETAYIRELIKLFQKEIYLFEYNYNIYINIDTTSSDKNP